MKRVRFFVVAVLLCWGLVGCVINEQPEFRKEIPTPSTEQTPLKQTEDKATEPKPNVNRPSTKQDTIALEGMEEEFTFTLFKDQALGFSTYIIEDMVAEQVSSAEGDALFVYAKFGGVVNKQAAIRVFSLAKDSKVDLEQLVTLMRQQLSSSGLHMQEVDLKSESPLATANRSINVSHMYSLESSELIGAALFFEHGDRVYVLYYHYPPEYADGFGPRVSKFIEDIVWFK